MIGSMRHRIKVTNAKRVSNGRGGWTTDYAAGDSIMTWAAAELLTINEQLRYREHQQDANMRFIIRDNPFINTDSRIEFNEDTYEVTQIAPAAARFLEVRAREV